MYYCRKTGKEFESKRGFINHLNKVYENPEEAYLNEYNTTPSKCIYCGCSAEFISFFKGYHYRCIDKECVGKFKYEGIKKSTNSIKEK